MNGAVWRSALPGLAMIGGGVVFLGLLLSFETQAAVAGLLAGGVLFILLAGRFGWLKTAGGSFARHEPAMAGGVFLAVLALACWFIQDHFPLLMLATVLLTVVSCFGLSVQFGFAGMVNFAGASFFGLGAYTTAVIVQHTGLPHLVALPIAGLAAGLLGSVLIWPMLRTRGHYAAVVTIAFAILFKTFLEVNDTLGGAQGLRIRNVLIFGWKPNQDIDVGSIEISHYFLYLLAALLLAWLAYLFCRRLERSWIGLSMDAVRIDETAAACFGFDIRRWKIFAFTWGNVLAGISGALYAMMVGYVAPNNFTFGDSMILVSIVLLGGIGNLWGVMVASALVILLPQKFQVIQEYRILLYAVLVMLILLFRPQGLLPRALRVYLPGGRR